MKNENNPLKGNESILAKVDPLIAAEIIRQAIDVYLKTGLMPNEICDEWDILMIESTGKSNINRKVGPKKAKAAKINLEEITLTQTDSECFLSYLKHHPDGSTQTIQIDPNELTKEQLIAILTRKK